MPIPAGMKQVTRDAFFAALSAEKRNIHPQLQGAYPYESLWKVVGTQTLFGWSEGQRNSSEDKTYALAK